MFKKYKLFLFIMLSFIRVIALFVCVAQVKFTINFDSNGGIKCALVKSTSISVFGSGAIFNKGK